MEIEGVVTAEEGRADSYKWHERALLLFKEEWLNKVEEMRIHIKLYDFLFRVS